MKRRLFIVLVIVVAAAAIVLKASSSADSVDIVIAHFNDLGGRVTLSRDGQGGVIRLAGEWRKIQKRHPEALLFVSGDLITGSPLSTLTKGEGVFRIANELGIDAFAPGNHEFDHGAEQYLRLKEIARFPFLAINMEFSQSREKIRMTDAPYMMFDVAGIKVGTVGAITPSTPFITFPENTRGVTFNKPSKTLRKIVEKVDRKAHLVVAITHLGMRDDRKLARKVRNIDLIVGGHSYDVTYRPVKVGKTRIVNAGGNGEYLGVVHVKINPATEKVLRVSGKMIPVGPDSPTDSGIETLARRMEQSLGVELDRSICFATKKWIEIAMWGRGSPKL